MRDAPMHLEAMLGELLRHDADETHPRILSLRAAIAALQSQQDGAQGGEAVAWPGEAKRATDGDEWIARTRQVEHRMDEAQSMVWNACLRACKAAHDLSRPTIAPQATPAAVDDVRWLLKEARAGLRHVAATIGYTYVEKDLVRCAVIEAALAPQSTQGDKP